jgi:hypothetical protein
VSGEGGGSERSTRANCGCENEGAGGRRWSVLVVEAFEDLGKAVKKRADSWSSLSLPPRARSWSWRRESGANGPTPAPELQSATATMNAHAARAAERPDALVNYTVRVPAAEGGPVVEADVEAGEGPAESAAEARLRLAMMEREVRIAERNGDFTRANRERRFRQSLGSEAALAMAQVKVKVRAASEDASSVGRVWGKIWQSEGSGGPSPGASASPGDVGNAERREDNVVAARYAGRAMQQTPVPCWL